MSVTTYFVFPTTFFEVTAAPFLVEHKVREAYALFDRPAPVLRKEVGRLAIALWSSDEEAEGVLAKAIEIVEASSGFPDECRHVVTHSFSTMRGFCHVVRAR